MAITPISGVNSAAYAAKTAGTVRTEEAAKTVEKAKNVDTFQKTSGADKAEEAPKRLTSEQLKALQEERTNSFQQMLVRMLKTQADKADAAKNGLTLNADLFTRLNVTPADSAKALQAISEDGEWGVNAVATRIMDMAVALSGGDPSKIAVLQDAVEKGFEAAGAQWGGKLPSITGDTHAEITKRFDYWKEHGSLDGYSMKAEAAE